MRKLVKIAFVATNLAFVIAAAAQARPVRNYQDGAHIERESPLRAFRSEADRTQRPSRRPPPSVPEHIGPVYDVPGAP
jgi:hypothetical protein